MPDGVTYQTTIAKDGTTFKCEYRRPGKLEHCRIDGREVGADEFRRARRRSMR